MNEFEGSLFLLSIPKHNAQAYIFEHRKYSSSAPSDLLPYAWNGSYLNSMRPQHSWISLFPPVSGWTCRFNTESSCMARNVLSAHQCSVYGWIFPTCCSGAANAVLSGKYQGTPSFIDSTLNHFSQQVLDGERAWALAFLSLPVCECEGLRPGSLHILNEMIWSSEVESTISDNMWEI